MMTVFHLFTFSLWPLHFNLGLCSPCSLLSLGLGSSPSGKSFHYYCLAGHSIHPSIDWTVWHRGRIQRMKSNQSNRSTNQPTNQPINQSINQSIWIFFIIFLWNTISINQKINHPGFLPGPPGKPRHPTALRLHSFPLHNLDCPK